MFCSSAVVDGCRLCLDNSSPCHIHPEVAGPGRSPSLQTLAVPEGDTALSASSTPLNSASPSPTHASSPHSPPMSVFDSVGTHPSAFESVAEEGGSSAHMTGAATAGVAERVTAQLDELLGPLAPAAATGERTASGDGMLASVRPLTHARSSRTLRRHRRGDLVDLNLRNE